MNYFSIRKEKANYSLFTYVKFDSFWDLKKFTVLPCQPRRKPCPVAERHCTEEVKQKFLPDLKTKKLIRNYLGLFDLLMITNL